MKNTGQRKKRILFVITKSNMGGAQRYVYELATHFQGRFEIAVACGGNGILKERLAAKKIKTFTIASFERDIDIKKEWYAMHELSTIIKAWGPDIVHLNSSKAGGIGAFVSRIHGVPLIIFTAHGWPFYEKRNMLWRIMSWFFSYLTALFSHKVVVVSKHDFDKHMMPFISKKLLQINTAVPEFELKERHEARTLLYPQRVLDAHRNDVWVVSTGELTQNKNLLRLLYAVEVHNKTNTRKVFLTLMGEGEERNMLEEYVRQHGLERQVHFLGFVEKARSYLSAFDVFVLPSLKEGLPYGILEAGASGLYVIASDVGGVPDIIEPGKTGVLIDPSDTKSLITAFQEIPEDLSLLGKELQSRVRKEFSLSEMLQKTEQLYL